MSPPTMTPRSFATRFLPGAFRVLAEGGLHATCPACSTVNALYLDADFDGGYATCEALNETPCDTAAFAASLGWSLGEWTARLECLRSDDAITANLAPVTEIPQRSSLADAFLSRSDLDRLEAPTALIADTVLRRTLTFVAGPPASGKSFHLFAWAASVATGTAWRGREVAEGRVLYIVGEGVWGVGDRLTAWEAFHGVKIPDDHIDFADAAVQLAEPEALEALLAVVRERDYDLIVVDTLSRSAVGIDENNQGAMSSLIASLDRVLKAMSNGALVVAHHSSKAGSGLRGSSVLEGAADSVYATSKVRDDETRKPSYRLARSKNKYGPEDDFLTFAWHDDDARKSGLLIEPGRAARPEPRQPLVASLPTWTVLLGALANGQSFTRSEAFRIASAADIPKTTFYSHFNELQARLAVVIHKARNPHTRTPDYFHLDLAEAKRHGLPTERFAPLEGFNTGFLDDVPAPSGLGNRREVSGTPPERTSQTARIVAGQRLVRVSRYRCGNPPERVGRSALPNP